MVTLAEVKEENAYWLAGMAGCGTPDSQESAGARFLVSVRDSLVEAVEYGRIGPDATEDVSDVAHEIADDAPSVYTHTRWTEFVDLAAYQEEEETGEGWSADPFEMAGDALSQIAYRLVIALADDLAPEESEDDEDDETVYCRWFALCMNEATGTSNHPTIGDVPTCDTHAEMAERA